MGRAHQHDWEFVLTDSLEKVFPDQRPVGFVNEPKLEGFLGERLSFQLAVRPPSVDVLNDLPMLVVDIDGVPDGAAVVSSVELVPVALAAFDGHDDGYLRDTVGLYPDLLRPLENGEAVAPLIGSWRSWWIDVAIDEVAHSGSRDLTVRVRTAGRAAEANTSTSTFSDSELFAATVPIEVHPWGLPELDIVSTHWLHVDSLAHYYNEEPFSERHWEIIESFVASAADMGANSLLTPVWTPPLDTAVGGTRLRSQLITIRDVGPDRYEFVFDDLTRWCAMCRRHGIHTLEMAHLFTQWGARATPAVYVETDDGLEHRFGWHVPATDPRWRALLEQLLPALRLHLEEIWPDGNVIFHISDEPHADMLDDYRTARSVVNDLLEGCLIADAISNFEFASTGAVDLPVVATNHVTPFLDAGISPFWVYHCVAQYRDVANRYIAQPGVRGRVIGRQIFSADVKGFLHWGFNFYLAHHSTHPIDPFRDTTGAGAFPSGDPFIVYPSPDGDAWPSMRHRHFEQAMNDHRALQLLRDLTSRAQAVSLVDEGGTLTFSSFSYDRSVHLNARADVNRAIVAELKARRPAHRSTCCKEAG